MKRTTFTLLTLMSTILSLSACHSKATVEDTPKNAPNNPPVVEQQKSGDGQCLLNSDCKTDEVCQPTQTCQKNKADYP